MKVLHVIPSLSPSHGGPSAAMLLIAKSLVITGVEVDIATTDDDGPNGRLDVPLQQPTLCNGWRIYHFRKQTEFYKVSLPLKSWVRQNVSNYDLLHIHALFSHTSVAAARVARHAGTPYIIRPLGVLNRWGMRNRRRILKWLSFRFIEGPCLRHAAATHYASEAERNEAKAAGATGPVAIISLGVDIDRFGALAGPERFWDQFPQAKNRTIILFLSRLDPIKGLDLLLPAFANAHKEFSDSLLVIVGNGHADYVARLHAQTRRLGITDSVIWTGYLGGIDKLSALSAATVFTLPSYSENFGIALVEALAAGLPCITTAGVAVSAEIRKYDAGVVVPSGDEVALRAALEQLLENGALRARLSRNARLLAVERFSLQTMGLALKSLYQRILNESRKA